MDKLKALTDKLTGKQAYASNLLGESLTDLLRCAVGAHSGGCGVTTQQWLRGNIRQGCGQAGRGEGEGIYIRHTAVVDGHSSGAHTCLTCSGRPLPSLW